jgi:hypothetical protein
MIFMLAISALFSQVYSYPNPIEFKHVPRSCALGNPRSDLQRRIEKFESMSAGSSDIPMDWKRFCNWLRTCFLVCTIGTGSSHEPI